MKGSNLLHTFIALTKSMLSGCFFTSSSITSRMNCVGLPVGQKYSNMKFLNCGLDNIPSLLLSNDLKLCDTTLFSFSFSDVPAKEGGGARKGGGALDIVPVFCIIFFNYVTKFEGIEYCRDNMWGKARWITMLARCCCYFARFTSSITSSRNNFYTIFT